MVAYFFISKEVSISMTDKGVKLRDIIQDICCITKYDLTVINDLVLSLLFRD